MRKVLLIIGIFGVLSVGMFISGCGDEDKVCNCTKSYSGPGSENLQNVTYSETIDENNHCSDVLNTTYSEDVGGGEMVTATINCVGY